jgi:serine/threonine protein kinase/uncharacterized RDD family membrane protein YckC/ribosomal protein L40E
MNLVCIKCQWQNRATAKFCQRCGAMLGRPGPFPVMGLCPSCGGANAPHARFCKKCGQQMSPPSSLSPPPPLNPPLAPPFTPLPPTSTGRLPVQSQLGAGRYLILELLGQGGMGAVYLAEDFRLPGTLIAIKEMSDADLAPHERREAVAAFKQEAHLLARLRHPNIPRVSDIFSENGKEYLVMEYVDGETLEQRLEKSGSPLPEPDVLKWAEQLCAALYYLHSRQPPIIFRDLKPANIMVDKQGQVKLIDFGIVRFFKPGQATDTTKLGSPGYSPPEQYGKGQTDERSDVYALAATLHQLLTGRDPADDPFNFVPPRGLNSRVSQKTSDILMKALAGSPVDRWPDVVAFRQALSPAAQPQVVTLPPVRASGAPAYQFAGRASSPSGHSPPLAAASAPPGPKQKRWLAPPVPASPVPAPSFRPDTEVLVARAVAHLIDGFILGLLFILYSGVTTFVLAIAYEIAYEIGAQADPWLSLATGFIIFLAVASGLAYYTFFHARWGQTPGKKLMSIELVGLDGSCISWPLALWRTVVLWGSVYLGSLFCLLIFPYIVPLLNSERRALHDYLAGTIVVRK